MLKLNYAIILISILSMALGAQSALVQSQSAAGLLQGYNVSNSIISSLTYTHINSSTGNYLLAYSGTNPSFLINTTGGAYSIVLNTTQIDSIIGPAIIQSSLSKINTTYLRTAMMAYNKSSSGSLGQCINSTGLDRGTCTFANNCQSCTSIPACGGVSHGSFQSAFYATGGVYGIVAYGIMQLESQYGSLESNFSTYFSTAKNLSSNNAAPQLNKLVASFDNISSITNLIYQNPLFPPPATANYGQCSSAGSGTGNVPSQNGPWYCSSVGYCEFLTYNYSLLGNIQSYLNQVSALPISSQQVSQIAVNVSANEHVYVAPIVTAQNLKRVNEISNTTLLGYNRTVTGATSLLTHISNSMLSNSLSTIEANYSILTNNYNSVDLTLLNKSLAKQYSSLKAIYGGLNATYASALNLAANNTITLVELQIGNTGPSTQLTSLSFQQAQLNSQLGASIKNLSTLNNQLRNVSVQSKTLSNNPSISQSIARAVDAPVASAVLAAMGSTYSGSLQLAPILSLIPALILGIIVLLGIMLYRNGLRKKHRIAMNQRTMKNWSRLFLIAAGLVILVLIATFIVASAANQSAPISSFISAVHGSKTVIVALNGTNNTAMVSCANRIKSSLTAINKTAKIITMGGIACNNGVPLDTVDRCLAVYAANNEPVVILTNSNLDTITSYSYYGSILSVDGNQQFMSSCIAATMIR